MEPSNDNIIGSPGRRGERVDVGAVIRGVSLKTVVIALAALGILLILLAAMQALARPIAIVVAGIAIAEAFVPLVSHLQRRMPRTVAVLLIYLVLFILVGGLAWIVVPRIAAEAQSFVEDLPRLLNSVQNQINEWDPFGDGRLLEMLESRLGASAGQFTDLPVALANSAFELFLIVAISIYWLLGAPELLRFTLSLFPEERRGAAEDVLSEMGQSMGGYVRGAAIVAFIMGVLAYVGLWVIGVQFALVLAVIAGILEIVPVLGPIIAGIPMIAVALTDSFTTALIVLAYWIVVQQFESYVLTPNIVKSQAHIPELVVIIAIFAGGTVGGILGALVAIPVSGALKVLIIRLVAPTIRRWAGTEPHPKTSSTSG